MNDNKTNDFKKIVTREIPLIDVRAPIEYTKGSFKNTINLPLMNDEERRLVGICYKEKGNEQAIQLGHQLVSGTTREKRIEDWISFIRQYPNSMLFCFRGGLRSKISQEWLLQKGVEITRLDGGYKAFRNYLIDSLDPIHLKSKPILLGGYTGSGKTILLKNFLNFIDLEGIANHRGSSFGNFVTPQPSQIDFENNLAYALIQHQNNNYQYLLLEDEGRHVGRCYLPKNLADHFNNGSLVVLNIPLEQRVRIIWKEYVIDSQKKYVDNFGEKGYDLWYYYIEKSLSKIRKRLGGIRYKAISESLLLAYDEQMSSGKKEAHQQWILSLLNEYYDPMYHYQIQHTNKKIIFQGNEHEVYQFLKTYEK